MICQMGIDPKQVPDLHYQCRHYLNGAPDECARPTQAMRKQLEDIKALRDSARIYGELDAKD